MLEGHTGLQFCLPYALLLLHASTLLCRRNLSKRKVSDNGGPPGAPGVKLISHTVRTFKSDETGGDAESEIDVGQQTHCTASRL